MMAALPVGVKPLYFQSVLLIQHPCGVYHRICGGVPHAFMDRVRAGAWFANCRVRSE